MRASYTGGCNFKFKELNYLKLIAIYAGVVFFLHLLPTGGANNNGLALSSRQILFIRAGRLSFAPASFCAADGPGLALL